MNELAHLIKSLGYSLTVVPPSDKCIQSLAKRHELKTEMERLLKGVTRYRPSGYDLEAKQVPTEQVTLNLLERIQTNQLKITELQQYCNLLLSLERKAIIDFIASILKTMDERAKIAESIIEAMNKNGLRIEDIK